MSSSILGGKEVRVAQRTPDVTNGKLRVARPSVLLMGLALVDFDDGLLTGERARTCIFASNYGEASALNFLGSRYRLPPAISGHNSYYLWGPGSCKGEVMIAVGIPRGDVEQVYADVERAAIITCRYCVPEENDVPVYVGTRLKVPIRELWPQTKHYE